MDRANAVDRDRAARLARRLARDGARRVLAPQHASPPLYAAWRQHVFVFPSCIARELSHGSAVCWRPSALLSKELRRDRAWPRNDDNGLERTVSGSGPGNPDYSAGRQHAPPYELLHLDGQVGESEQDEITVRGDCNKEAAINFGRYALALANCTRIF